MVSEHVRRLTMSICWVEVLLTHRFWRFGLVVGRTFGERICGDCSHALHFSLVHNFAPQGGLGFHSPAAPPQPPQHLTSKMSTTTTHTIHGYFDLMSSALQPSPGPRKTSTPQTRRQQGRIVLNTRNALLLVCPLLPTKQPTHALSMPEEVWRQILEIVLGDIQLFKRALGGTSIVIGADLLSVCKAFKASFSRLLYRQRTQIYRVS